MPRLSFPFIPVSPTTSPWQTTYAGSLPATWKASLTCSMWFHKRNIKEGITGLHFFFPAGFESHHDVQAGPEHLIFLPWPPTSWQYRVSITSSYVFFPLWTSHRPSWSFLSRIKKSKAKQTKPKHLRLSNCPKPSYKQQVSSPREKSCLKNVDLYT